MRQVIAFERPIVLLCFEPSKETPGRTLRLSLLIYVPQGRELLKIALFIPFSLSLSFPLPSLLASPALQPGDHTGRNRSVMLGGGPYFLRGRSKDYDPSCSFYSLWWMMGNVNQALIWLCFIFTKYFHIYYPTHHSYPKPARLAGTPLYR